MGEMAMARIGSAPDPATDGKAESNLTVREARFVAALTEGGTVAQAAAAAGVSVRSGFRWKARPEIAAAVRARLADALGQARGILASGSARAARSLVAMVDGKADPARVSAAKAVLESATKLAERDEQDDLRAQIAELRATTGGMR
jgi:hypothetical protein